MKVSISLSEADVAYLDAETLAGTYPSRSAAVAAAITWLRRGDLVAIYDEAFEEWDVSGESDVWTIAAGDGIR